MQTLIYSSLLFTMSLMLSCVNTKNKSVVDNNNARLTQGEETETLVEVKKEDLARLEDQYLADAIYLSIKTDSGIMLDVGEERISLLNQSPLSSFQDSVQIIEITKPMLAIKPNLYRLTFPEDTDLLKVITSLQSYPFVEYAELIPINK